METEIWTDLCAGQNRDAWHFIQLHLNLLSHLLLCQASSCQAHVVTFVSNDNYPSELLQAQVRQP